MAWTAERIRSLLEEDEEMEDALKAVKAAADENGGTVDWPDVEDELTTGQWGRIIEEGILVSADDGFEFSDPERVEEVLGADDIEAELDFELPEIDVDADTSWTKWDKAAAGVTALLIVGYLYDPVQNAIGNTIHLFFGPLERVLPLFVVIFAAALLTGLYSTLLQANLMNTELVGAYQAQMNEVQEKKDLAEQRGDEEAVKRIQQMQMDMVSDQLGMFKAQFRPMVWIMLLTIPIFLWIWWMVGQTPETDLIMPIFGEIERWNQGVVGPFRAWILWYIVASISFTQVLRKALHIVMMPD